MKTKPPNTGLQPSARKERSLGAGYRQNRYAAPKAEMLKD